MWQKIVELWSETAQYAGGILHLMLFLIAVPIAGLIFIVETHLSLGRSSADSTAGLPLTADTMDEDALS